MNKLVIAALLAAAAACSKKPPAPDCDAAIAKGADAYLAYVKQKTPPAMLDRMVMLTGKLKEAWTERCKADKWTPEVVACYGAIDTPASIQKCQDKLTDDQRNKLIAELREEMMGSRMPQGMSGHPQALSGSAAGSGAPAAEPAAGSAAPPSGGSAAEPAAGSAAPAAGAAEPAAGSAAK